ncbi:MAG: leucine-rich repeat domain-containing protein [Oscillospiraceae bacterium]|nr:leucine-rich repeat domain-containing protein [Oscillospiraceae bacterium]
MKKILSLFLAILTIFSVVSMASGAFASEYDGNYNAFDDDGAAIIQKYTNTEKSKSNGTFIYIVDDDGTAVIQKVVDKNYTGKTFVIPAKIDGHKVKGIYIDTNAYQPFADLKKSGNADTITSVKVEEGITQLDVMGLINRPKDSFYLDEYSVKTIHGIFSDLKNLTKVSLPSTLRAIDAGMFSYCTSLKSIKIPDKVEFIDYAAFLNCTSLKSIKLPSKLKRISERAFRDCVSLETINIPTNIEKIETMTFSGCKNLKSIKLPSKLTSIGIAAFAYCESLSGNLKIPDKVRVIEDKAFYGCKSLTGKMRLPKKLEKVGDGAFAFCSGLTGFRIADGNKYFSQKGGVLFNKDKTKIYCYLSGKETKEYKVPSTVKSVSSYAFAGTKYLQKITLSDKMKKVPSYAFYKSKVKTIILPKSINQVKDFAFDGCKKLKSLTVRNPKCDMPYYCNGINKKMTVYGYKNSTAQKFAKKAKLKFVEIK